MTKKIPFTSSQPEANSMWGGQFTIAPDALMDKINVSVGFDKVLYRYDIAGSIAHASMLADQGILTAADAKKIISGLKAIEKEIEAGAFEFKDSLEDIHMNIEAALKERIGDAGGRLHTGRSRNDQVATDMRLYARDAAEAIDGALQNLQAALLERASEHASTIMPGFTHLQAAQPVTLGHHLLAYTEMFGRDRGRFSDAAERLNESPLGAAALAGTSFPIDRDNTAQALGFREPMRNSLDAVSARDFILELLAAASICSVHLSRLAEEMVNWSSVQFGFIRFSDAWSTGSSIMPQKRNPDAAELVRGKAGRVFGHLMAMLATVKALPLAYNKDLQEDKEPLFDAVDTLMICVQAITGMVADFAADKAKMEQAASLAFANATDLADWLVRVADVPFRDAHHITARLVKMATDKHIRLEELSLADMQDIDSRITKEAFTVLSPLQSVNSRKSFGGTAPANVKKSITAAKKRYL